ncbi:MAG: class B sortase [Ruminococcus sp.]
MRTELYCVRSKKGDLSPIADNIKEIATTVDSEASVRLLFRTEIDSNPKKIKRELEDTFGADNPPELFIFANALDTENSASFRRLFTPFIEECEAELGKDIKDEETGKMLHRNIKVYPIENIGSEYPAYCFTVFGKKFIVLPQISFVEGSYTEYLVKAIHSAKELFVKATEECPEGYILAPTQKEGKAKSFLKSFIPWKGDSVKSIVFKIVVLAAIVVFLVGAGMLFNFYIYEPMVNNSNINEIQSIFHGGGEPVTDESGNIISESGDNRNWKGIQKINNEIVGWIKVDKTKIDYPVLLHEGDNADAQFYLYRNYKKEYSDFGSIFVDYRCTEGVKSKNLILHGHNMGSDDSMFGSLIKYSRAKGWVQGNTEFYKSSPIVYFDTPEENSEYIIFATMKIDVSNENKAIFNYLISDFDSEAQFMNFIYNIKERSYLDVNVPINENDTIITLSTCSYESDNMRTVVIARKLRENETYDKYVETVKQQTPVSEVSSTFSQELEAGNINWYDGKGKLEGSESLEFLKPEEMFVVKFLDAKGNVISSQQVIKGKDAKAPETEPRKAADSNYTYTFKGWDKSYKNVQKNLVIKPVFTKHARPVQVVETTKRVTEAEEVIVTKPPATQKPTKPETKPPVATTAPVIETKPATTVPVVTDPVETASP